MSMTPEQKAEAMETRATALKAENAKLRADVTDLDIWLAGVERMQEYKDRLDEAILIMEQMETRATALKADNAKLRNCGWTQRQMVDRYNKWALGRFRRGQEGSGG